MTGAMKWVVCGWVVFFASCSDDGPGTPPLVEAGRDVPTPKYTLEQLRDPETCNACHERHYRDWVGSMHAYASDDPLFLAMNERGQREAKIGNFCVNCHAPMAVASVPEGTIVDTAMLKQLPKPQRGVTCYFCHSIDDVKGTHNNPLHLANDGVMRGRFSDAVPNEAHASMYSEFLDGTQLASASACGSCHDIVNDKNAHVERTFEEWQETVFSTPKMGLTCAQCHAKQTPPEVIADGPKVKGVFSRLGHEHTMAAVDRAITPFPEMDLQADAISKELNNPPELQTALCVANLGSTDTRIGVLVDNLQAGHKWPSGAAQDRQLWFEVTAYAGGNQIYQSGAVPEFGKDPDITADDDLWLMRDCMFDEQGKETHLFWETSSIESNTLPGQVTFDPMDKRYYQTHLARGFPGPGSSKKITTMPDRVTLRVWLQAFPYKVLEELMPELTALGYGEAQIEQMKKKLAPVQVTTDFAGGPQGILEWSAASAMEQAGAGTFQNGNGIIPSSVIPVGVLVRCVTGTAMAMRVQNTVAPVRRNCTP
jgi:hypothetical protein